MKKYCILILTCFLAFSGTAVAEEGPQVDFILLIDTSLSMVPAIDELKQFVAGGIVGRFVQQGDWVAVLSFYGRSSLIWEGDIQSEADKASLVRSLHALEATGRFTDIGAALDDMKQLVIKRNRPEIPKYILLLTDEVQEAPPGSNYPSDDFTISHELLEYIRRVDLGSFQAITIGYGLASRIESDLESLMKTLNDPPDRPERFLPGSTAVQTQAASSLETAPSASVDAETRTDTGTGTAPSGDQDGTEAVGDGSVGSGSKASGKQNDGSHPSGAASDKGPTPLVFLVLALVMGALMLGFILFFTRKSKKPRITGKPPEDKEKDDPSGLKDGRK